MNTLTRNDIGGITYATQQRVDGEENRSEFLADLRLTLDALGETCECQQKTRRDIDKLLAMLTPGAATDELKKQIESDMETVDALNKFNTVILERVRNGTYRRFAALFDQ